MSDYVPFPDDYPLREDLVEYSEDVLAGKIVACQKHKWACARFLRDLERENSEEFPYIFDEQKALDFLSWMRLFKHRKGVLEGKRIEPHPIQVFIFGNVYGWVHRETGYRRFRKMYWQVGRKNAKSQSLACVATYELMGRGVGGSEVYCAACKTEQARIIWEEANEMLERCEELKGKFKVAYGRIRHPKSGSFMRALSKEDRKTGDGLNPQCAVVDEFHAHADSAILDILVSGMVSRPEPLSAIITTAGFDLNNPCYRVEYHYCSDILNPDKPIDNERYFVMINELDKDEDGNPTDEISNEAAWEKANPILCSYDEGRESLRADYQKAKDVPEEMRNFLTKNMNVWIDHKEQGYMNMAKWALCKGEIPDLRGKECYVGIDLSSKIDLSSVGFIFRVDGKYVVLSHSFIPEDRLLERRQKDKMPFDLWVQQGYISMTPGAVVDYRFIRRYIIDSMEQNGWVVREVCFDQWNATLFAQEMEDEGFTMVEIRQGIPTLGEPTKNFREEVYSGNVIHDGNPVLAWAMGNAVTRTDHSENIMLDKQKARDRIDPVAALINAHVRAMTREEAEIPRAYVIHF